MIDQLWLRILAIDFKNSPKHSKEKVFIFVIFKTKSSELTSIGAKLPC